MNAPAFRAAVFDFDGTLLDSMRLVVRAFAHAVEPWATWDGEVARRLITAPPRECLRRLLRGDETHVDEAFVRLADYGRRHASELRPFDGAAELLAGLRAGGVRVGLWTSRDRASTEQLVRTFGLDGAFAAMVCGDDLATHKPDPEGLRTVLERLGVGTHEAVYAGDAEVDIDAGHAVGVATVLILQGFEIDPGSRGRATHVAPSPSAAYAWIAARCGVGPAA